MRISLALSFLIAAASCGTSVASEAPPAPDLAGMEPPVRALLSETRAAVVAAPGDALAWGRYGMALHAHELFRPAAACYRAAGRCSPSDPRWAYLEGHALERLGESVEDALGCYRRAAALDPAFPPTHFRLGEILAAAGRAEEARDEFARVLELDPDAAAAHRGLALALVDLGEWSSALEHLERAQALVPGDPAVQAALARVHAHLGDADAARAAAERARAGGPPIALGDPFVFEMQGFARSAESCLVRARERLAAGDAAAALEDLAIVLAERPDDGAALDLEGQALIALQRFEEALAPLQRASMLQGPRPGRDRLLARASSAVGKGSDAILYLQRASDGAPEDATLLAELGMELAKGRRLPEAVDAFASAAGRGRLAPNEIHTWANALLALERFADARTRYLEVLERQPENPDALFGLGRAEEGLGLVDEALARYRAVVARVPTHRAAARLAELEGAASR